VSPSSPSWPLQAAGFLAILTLALPGPALAQDGSIHDTAAARSLFREGVVCADAHDWACAADRFQRAYALRASPVIGYNLGTTLIALGRLVEGTEHLQAVARDDTSTAQMRADAQRAADAVAARLARVTVHVQGELEGVQLTIDGRALASSLHGAAAPVDPGDHLLEARRGREVVASAPFSSEPGGSSEVSIVVPDAPELAPVAAAEPAPRIVERIVVTEAPPSDDGPWIGLGIGAGVLVIGGAILIGFFVASPTEPMPYGGSLGTVEIGR
jgi:hypothetical protein